MTAHNASLCLVRSELGEPRGKPQRSRKQPNEITFDYPHDGSLTGSVAPNGSGALEAFRRRNTQRGIRSVEATHRRNQANLESKRIGRQRTRIKAQWAKDPTKAFEELRRWETIYANEALDAKTMNVNSNNTHGGPTNPAKWFLNQKYRLATLNVMGLRGTRDSLGKRELIETWMTKHDIDILLLQETKINVTQKETREHHTIFFSGSEGNEEEGHNDFTHAGVAIMIKNKHLNKIADIEPIDDRMMKIHLRGQAVTTTIINVYMYTAENTDRNGPMYERLEKHVRKDSLNGPTYTGGDFNARIQCEEGQGDARCIGPHTFDKAGADLTPTIAEQGKLENRRHMLDHCVRSNQTILHTWFQKPDNKLATWRHPQTKPDSPLRRHTTEQAGTYDTLDYWLVGGRWKYTCTNCESDMMANINTDHYPLISSIKIKLKANKTNTINKRPQY